VGTYRVSIETGTVPSALVATGDFDGGTDSRADVVLGSDQSVTGVDFGYDDAPAVGSGGSGLPFTGGQFGMSFAVAAGAILAGALMFLVGRRRVASSPTRR
jgi:LPXTG-motif cell wall-anchored protein